MPLPVEDAYFQIGSDTTRFWSTAQKSYVQPNNIDLLAWLAGGRTIILLLSEASLNQLLADLGLGDLAPTNTLDQIRGLDPILLKIAFNHENRIRTLEAKQPLTLAGFKTALRILLS